MPIEIAVGSRVEYKSLERENLIMGLLTAIQHKDFMAIASDSRATYMDKNGEVMTYPNNIQSLFEIDNIIIYTAGDVQLLQNILKEYDSNEDNSINNLKTIAIKHEEAFREINPDLYAKNSRIVDLVMFTWEGEPIVYSIGSFNNYEISRIDCRQGHNFIALGFNSEQALQLLDSGFNDLKYYKQIEENKIRFDAENFFQDIYNDLACISIGGIMSFYVLGQNGVLKRHIYRIKEEEPKEVVN